MLSLGMNADKTLWGGGRNQQAGLIVNQAAIEASSAAGVGAVLFV